MKNLKRLMAGALALVMVLGMTLTVSATETDTDTATDVPSVEGHYVVKELDDKAVENVPADDVTAIKDVTDGDSTDTFAEAIKQNGTAGAEEVANALSGKEWLTKFFEVRTEPDGQTTVPDHNFDITIKVPGISSYAADEITIVHFNTESQKWETLSFELLDGDNVSVHFDSLSPTAVAVVVKAKTEPSNEESHSSSGSSGSSSKKSSSPKTGVETGWEMFALAAVAFALCGVSFSRKRKA